MRYVDLRSDPPDLDRLARFYDELFVPGFPDGDERESLATFAETLTKRDAGFHGLNNYHILLLLDGERPVAASIFDYMAQSNCGAIEYILTAEDQRGKGLGWAIHEHTIALMRQDATRAGHAELNAVMLEVNDPFQVHADMDIVDPFQRLLTWQRWGYQRLRFPYEQPALSAEQAAISYLLLGVKVIDPILAAGFPPTLAKAMVVDYLVWANRFTEHDPFYRAMSAYAQSIIIVPLEPFDVYIGQDPLRSLTVSPLTSTSGDHWNAFTALFERSFEPSPTTVDTSVIAHHLSRPRTDGSSYHAWTLSEAPANSPAGLATFFSMPGAGLLGYLVLEPPLRGRGLARVVCKRIERQMIRDRADLTHCYVECEPGSPQQAVFQALGFQPLPLRYRPPPVGQGADPMAEERDMTLLRKRLGDEIIVPPLDKNELRAHLLTILRCVYGLDSPETSACYRTFTASL